MSAAKSFAPRHFAGLADAKTIKTEQFLVTQMAIKHCVRRNALGVFTGDAGRGKTFAVDCATASLDRPVIRTLFGSQTSRREVARRMLAELSGFEPRGTYFQLSEELVEVFRKPHVAVIDEAQHLNQDCTFFLRYLIDHPHTQVTILLIGADGLWNKIVKDPTLQSRVYRRVEFRELPDDDLLRALPKYHPIYAGVDRELLQELMHRCNVVQHRILAVFTLTAADILEENGSKRLDEVTMEQALRLIGAGL